MNPTSTEAHITAQFNYWKQQREKIEQGDTAEIKELNPFITISREFGCEGYETAAKTSELINNTYKPAPSWLAYDRKVIDLVMENLHLSSELVETLTSADRSQMTDIFQTFFSSFPPHLKVYRRLAETVRTLAYNGNVIIVGRAGRFITRSMEKGYHVRVVAPVEWRIARISRLRNIPEKDAEKLVLEKNMEREEFLRNFIKFEGSDPLNYNVVINNAEHSVQEISEIIMACMKAKRLLP